MSETPVPQVPAVPYNIFFQTHPVGSNRKSVILNYIEDDKPQQLFVTFSWLCGQPCYVHLTHSYDRREIYVGTIDLFNNDLWSTPTSLTPKSTFFMHVRRFIKAYKAGRAQEFYQVQFVGDR